MKALKAKAVRPAYLVPPIPAGEPQTHLLFSPCLLAVGLAKGWEGEVCRHGDPTADSDDTDLNRMCEWRWGKRSSGFRAGTADSSPKTEAGTRELGLGSPGCE